MYQHTIPAKSLEYRRRLMAGEYASEPKKGGSDKAETEYAEKV